MAEINAKFLATAFTYMAVQHDLFEYWDKAKRAERPGEEPPALLDENGNALVSLDFVRIDTVYGKAQTTVFQVRMPKNAVDHDLEPGNYVLLNPSVNFYVSRDGKLRESWTAEGLDFN